MSLLINRNPHVSILYMGIFLFILMIAIPSQTFAAEKCAVMKKNSVALKAKTKVKKRVLRNEVFPFLGLSKNGVAVKTKINGQAYWLLSKLVRVEEGELCALNKLESNNKSVDPLDSLLDSSTDQYDSLPEDSSLDKMTKSSESKEFKAVSEVKSGWTYGVEAGYLISNSKKPFENLITPTPPSNVDVNEDTYDSPFVDSVSGGSGFDFSGFVQMPLSPLFSLKMQLGYMQRELSYVYRTNPNNTDQSFVTYNQLPQSENTVSFQSVYLTLMPKFSFSLFSVPMDFGLGIRGHYYLQQFRQERRTAPQKLTPYFVDSGYSAFEIEILPRLEVKFQPIYVYLQLTNQLTGASHFNMDPHLGVGIEF